jgi:3-phosphoshikimate 1-carboxyvinyltransferase
MSNVTVKPSRTLEGTIVAPASKAFTQRVLIAAALSEGSGKVLNPLVSEDSEATLRAITALGAKVTKKQDYWFVEGAVKLKAPKKPINVGDSGATLRFMIPVAALAEGNSVFLLSKGLKKRPIEPLIESLKQLGVQVNHITVGKKEALEVVGGGIKGGVATMPGDVSSQFVSGLMFACPKAQNDTTVCLTTPLESKDYVRMTHAVLEKHQVKTHLAANYETVSIPANQKYKPVNVHVQGDFSSAAFLLAAASIVDSQVEVDNLEISDIQGDKAIVDILKRMEVDVKFGEGKVKIEGTGARLEPVQIDATDIPDLVPICATLACYANGTSTIFNAGRLRFKESDRLASMYSELLKMGAKIVLDPDKLTIEGTKLHGATIDPHNDHRIAMACAVAALGAQGTTIIQNAECIRKSYPLFFTDLASIGANVSGGEFDR